MKQIFYLFIAASLAATALSGCQKTEETGPDPVSGLKAIPGRNRAKVEFVAPQDALTAKVFYLNGQYVEFPVDKASAVQSAIAEGLPEGEHIIRVVTLGANGVASDPKGVVVKVFGDSYAAQIANRDLLGQNNPSATSVEMLFSDCAPGEQNVWVVYTTTSGAKDSVSVSKTQNSVTINNIDLSKDYFYYTVYKPVEECIDQYSTSQINAKEAAIKNLVKDAWIITRSGNGVSPAWIQADMIAERKFDGFAVTQGFVEGGTFATRYKFEYSNDGSNWTTAKEGRLKCNGYLFTVELPETIIARFVRLTATETYEAGKVTKFADIDLYNDFMSTAKEAATLPVLANAKAPFKHDGIDRCAVIPGRFYRITDWIHNPAADISTDGATGQFCTWTAAAWGVPSVTNGKIYQQLNLLPGLYSLVIDAAHTTDTRCLDMYAYAVSGTSVPNLADITTSPVTLGSADVVAHRSSVFSVPFTVSAPSTVCLGVVYTTHDFYAISGVWPWSDMYINSFELQAR